MPKYMDYHAKLPPMPPEVMTQMQQKVKAGKPDQYGAKPLNAYIDAKGGVGWCLTEAPNADAVCNAHKDMGIQLAKGEVHEVQSLV